jgi:hypothetical protein
MRTRTLIAGALAALAVVGGAASVIVVASGVRAESPAHHRPLLDVWNTAPVDPSVPAYPTMPTADTLPSSFTAEERASALLWLDHMDYVTQCMVDAGFTNFHIGALWQPGLPEYPAIAWQGEMSNAEKARSATTWFGDPGAGIGNGVGADYHWELGGCDGYGWHKAGVDHPY